MGPGGGWNGVWLKTPSRSQFRLALPCACSVPRPGGVSCTGERKNKHHECQHGVAIGMQYTKHQAWLLRKAPNRCPRHSSHPLCPRVTIHRKFSCLSKVGGGRSQARECADVPGKCACVRGLFACSRKRCPTGVQVTSPSCRWWNAPQCTSPQSRVAIIFFYQTRTGPSQFSDPTPIPAVPEEEMDCHFPDPLPSHSRQTGGGSES